MNGSLHVLRMYFSSEKSEEIQIIGRTGRHGMRGSVSTILLEQDILLQYNLTNKDIYGLDGPVLYQFMNSKRSRDRETSLQSKTPSAYAAER